MDLGVITSEGVGEAQAATSINAVGSDPFGINISTSIGSGLLKQQRSGTSLQDSWRASKLPRPNEFGGSFFSQNQNPTTLLRSGSMIPSTNGQTMISFSSQSQTPLFPEEDGVKTSAFPFFLSPSQEQQLSSKTSEKAAEAIRGPFARFRGPFTPSQWMELEHQALIYKHILANVPVPSHLLIPLKKSFNPYAFTGFSPGSYGSSSLGWGSFHLGFAGSTDPEPGRCRRTDGKKWRCSRDAVPDQKYCERHINRGRHRSRKPVEGQTGHAVSGSTAPKVALNASSSSASVMSSSNVSNCLGAVQHQFKNMQPGPAAANTANEHLVSRMQDLQSQGISVLGDAMNLKSKDSSFSSQKPHGLLGGSSQPEFGIVSPHSLLNPSQKSSRLNSRETDSFTSFNEQDARGQHPLRHFIDNWPKDRSDRGSVTWPEELKSDWTQLSMSIPMSSSEFSSSSNSPPQEKTTLSPLRLAREIDHIQMGLSVNNNDLSGQNQKQQHSNWLPVSWGSSNSSSLGGPLGEVLNSTTYSSVVGGGSKNSSSALNLMTEVWVDGNSPQMGCSPTGVLQKSTFVTLSNSSSGSSPRGDNNNNNNNNKKAPKNASLCDDILGSTLVSSASIPSI